MPNNALVIGGEGGIGSAICSTLKDADWTVISADVSIEFSDPGSHIPIDITDEESINKAAESVRETTGKLDALIISSGVFDHFPLSEYESGRLQRILEVNLVGVADCVNSFLGLLNRGGKIVILSSETSMVGLPFQPYGMSKRMLECYIDSIRQECKLIGIHVVSIRPGAHDTELLSFSKEALSRFNRSSAYSPYLGRVEKEGVQTIDRGGADPADVATVVKKAVSSSKPRAHYNVNVSFRFHLVRRLPRWLRENVIRQFLTR